MIPEWAWTRLQVLIGERPAIRRRPWPIRIPQWFWTWARWYLDRSEFRDQPFRSRETPPDAAPLPIPDWAWVRLRLLAAGDAEIE